MSVTLTTNDPSTERDASAPSSSRTKPALAASTTSSSGLGVLECGLRARSLALVLALSVTVFLFWGGPLWSAPPGSSHLVRIVGSYLIVLPAVAVSLAIARRWGWARLVSSTALIWGLKLVITASLYSLLATGAGNRYQPTGVHGVPRGAARDVPPQTDYQAAREVGPLGRISGVVRAAGVPVAHAVVVLERPPPGLALEQTREVRLAVQGALRATTVAATTRDKLIATHTDSRLHTLRLTREGQESLNIALAAGAPSLELPAVERGIYEWSCAIHDDERGTLVVVDHPYAATTDAQGRFALSGVPTGDLELAVIRHGRATARRALRSLGGDTETTVDIEEAE